MYYQSGVAEIGTSPPCCLANNCILKDLQWFHLPCETEKPVNPNKSIVEIINRNVENEQNRIVLPVWNVNPIACGEGTQNETENMDFARLGMLGT